MSVAQRLIDHLVYEDGYTLISPTEARKTPPGMNPARQWAGIHLRDLNHHPLATISLVDETLLPTFRHEKKRKILNSPDGALMYVETYYFALCGQVDVRFGIMFKQIALLRGGIENLSPAEKRQLFEDISIGLIEPALQAQSEEEFFKIVWRSAFSNMNPQILPCRLAVFSEIGRMLGISDAALQKSYYKMHECRRIADEF